MNYLAHAFLSNNQEELLVGNFIADHLRGNALSIYSDKIQKGIRLHREIDTFTDSHPRFRESKRLFYEGFEKYSGILIDIYFDHLLAKNFKVYSPMPLAEFSANVYKVYSKFQREIPKSGLGFLDYVIKNNIYTEYGRLEGIERVLYHLSHRIKHTVRLDHSVPIFAANEQQLYGNFQLFFQEAQKKFINTEN